MYVIECFLQESSVHEVPLYSAYKTHISMHVEADTDENCKNVSNGDRTTSSAAIPKEFRNKSG